MKRVAHALRGGFWGHRISGCGTALVGAAILQHTIEHTAQMPSQGTYGLVVGLALGTFFLVVAL